MADELRELAKAMRGIPTHVADINPEEVVELAANAITEAFKAHGPTEGKRLAKAIFTTEIMAERLRILEIVHNGADMDERGNRSLVDSLVSEITGEGK